MEDTSRRIEGLVFPRNVKVQSRKPPLPAITAGPRHEYRTESKNIPALPRRQHLALRRAGPQQPIVKKAKAENTR